MTAAGFVPLKRVARVAYGLGQPPETTDSGVPIIRATNIKRGKIVADDLIFSTLDRLPLDRAPLLAVGEILVVRSGAYTGDSAIVTADWEGAAPGYDLRVKPTLVEPAYLAWALLGVHALQQMDLAKSRAAQPHLNAEELSGIRVFVPPSGLQRDIIRFLDAETARIDALIKKKARMLSLASERARTALDLVIWRDVDREIPLMHAVQARRPVMYGIVLPGPDVGEPGVPIVKGGDVVEERLSLDRLCRTTPEIERPYARARLRPGDVVFAIRGGVGDAAIVPDELEGANITQDVARVAPAEDFASEWLLHVVRSNTFQRRAKELVRGATITGLNIRDLERVRIPWAKRERQEVDLEALRPVTTATYDLRRRLEHQIQLLREHRQALITAAVTGQLDVAKAAA